MKTIDAPKELQGWGALEETQKELARISLTRGVAVRYKNFASSKRMCVMTPKRAQKMLTKNTVLKQVKSLKEGVKLMRHSVLRELEDLKDYNNALRKWVRFIRRAE